MGFSEMFDWAGVRGQGPLKDLHRRPSGSAQFVCLGLWGTFWVTGFFFLLRTSCPGPVFSELLGFSLLAVYSLQEGVVDPLPADGHTCSTSPLMWYLSRCCCFKRG